MSIVKIYKDLEIAKTDDRLFSSFLEHMGRAIYTGIYEPTHASADEQGFRTDVLDLVKGLDVEYVRYPGGNFLSGYRWQDGVGEHRPARIDHAWRTIESNKVGINEFSDWSKKANTKIMGAVNLGTGTPQDASDFIEYCNFPGGTELSDLRRSHGYLEPHGIKIWCLGNEMDGPWQICALNADDYGKKAKETAKMMKLVDSSIELVLVGSSNSTMDTYPEWDRKVLEYCYDEIDYLSLHQYYENPGNDQEFLLSAYNLDQFINNVFATVTYVKTLKRSSKQVYLSLDEWNIWNYSVWNNSGYSEKPMSELEHHPRLLEDNYTYLESVVFASLTLVILNNSDKLKMACLAQLVNVIAPIFTEINGRVIKQGIYFPFELFTKYGKGTVLTTKSLVDTITADGEAYPKLMTSCVLDEDRNELNVFTVNLDLNCEVEVDFDLAQFGAATFIESFELKGKELNLANSFEEPENIYIAEEKTLNRKLAPCSYKLFRFKIGG